MKVWKKICLAALILIQQLKTTHLSVVLTQKKIPWNIDRLDERQLPLDGQFCPAAKGDICITVYIDVSQFLAM